MSAKNRYAKNRNLHLILVIVGAILVIGAIAVVAFKGGLIKFPGLLAGDIENSNKPRFAFNTEEFPDWVTSGNTWHSEPGKDSTSATMVISQCELGSNCSELVDDQLLEDKCTSTSKLQCEKLQQQIDAGVCMVHLYYFNHTINPDEAIADFLKPIAGFEVDKHEVGVKTLSMSTPEGNKMYSLHQYNSDNKSGGYKSGVSIGYIPLSSGHVEVQGICDEADQLGEVLPVLSSVRLEV